jgi:hypothetical protein
MNIFVLLTGRYDSFSFEKACGHITNFAVTQKSGGRILEEAWFYYPKIQP